MQAQVVLTSPMRKIPETGHKTMQSSVHHSKDSELPKGPMAAMQAIRQYIATRMVGQTTAVERAMTCILAGGHLLLEGPPGVGKTFLISVLGRALGMTSGRIQFTVDLLPADILGLKSSIRSPANSLSGPVLFSASCCWLTKSIARRPEHKARSCKRCKSGRLPSAK